MKVKTLILGLLIIAVFRYPLFSRIDCRIEGEVLEKDTGKPIEGAWINLFECSDPFFKDMCSSLWEVQTDSQGKFKIDELDAGQYFIVVIHRDYVVYGPAYELLDYLGGNTKGELSQYVQRGNSPQFFENKPDRNFSLEEGKIKHFIIQLERAAGLEITAKIKLPSGTSIYEGKVEISLIPLDSDKPSHGASFRGGSYKFRCLPAIGNIILKYGMAGYHRSQLSGINLQAGQNTKVEVLFDFTIGQVIHGIVKSKQLKYTLSGASVDLYQLDVGPSILYSTNTDKNGEFWFAGMRPGKYYISIKHVSTPRVSEVLIINQNEKVELIREL